MPPKDSIANTIIVSLTLCIVCSLLVSGAAVALKPLQERNKLLDRQRNIISAAGLADAGELNGKEIEELYAARVSRVLVDLETGEPVEEADDTYEPRKAAKNSELNTDIESQFDIGIAKREKRTWVYLVKGEGDEVEQVVLPIYGMGLWSTLYGFVAVDRDVRTIKGLTYYEHGETPGLGGEVENPAWKAKWIGKKIWEEGKDRDDSNLMVGVSKGAPPPSRADYEVDGLSGATITSRGVDSMLKYWFSDDGFGPYLRKLASKQGAAGGQTNS
jgi:Na+-transporting NADH:ubiquinone oxidoreductase subunit C